MDFKTSPFWESFIILDNGLQCFDTVGCVAGTSNL